MQLQSGAVVTVAPELGEVPICNKHAPSRQVGVIHTNQVEERKQPSRESRQAQKASLDIE